MLTVDENDFSAARQLATCLAAKLDPKGRIEPGELESIAFIEFADAALVFQGKAEDFKPFAHRRVAKAVRQHVRALVSCASASFEWSTPKLRPICYRVARSVVNPNDIHWAVSKLPKRTRIVVTSMYEEKARKVEVASSLGLTAGRICQLHDQAIVELRKLLGIR